MKRSYRQAPLDDRRQNRDRKRLLRDEVSYL
jgi:hypothetical protein